MGIGGRVLVHCYVGRSRSAALVLAFLMARRGMPLREAMATLRRVRPQARPNSGFYRELVEYEAQLRDAGVIVDAAVEQLREETAFILPSMRDLE